MYLLPFSMLYRCKMPTLWRLCYTQLVLPQVRRLFVHVQRSKFVKVEYLLS
jgi:hypothetical protein